MSREQPTPGMRREALFAEASRLLGAAREAAGVAASTIAGELGVTDTSVYRWEDPASTKRASLGDAMAPSIAREVVELLAARIGMVAVDLPEAGGVESHYALAVRVQRATAMAATVHLEAIADGHIDRREAAEMVAAADAAIVQLMALREQAQRATGEASTPVGNVTPIGGKR